MLRKCKNKRYNEANDEDCDGKRKYDLQERIKLPRFEQDREKYLIELPGEAITLKLIQKNGFDKPILVTKSDGLGLTVPPKSFLVRNVRDYVGHDRIIDVMDVQTQKNIEMSMRDWCKYYESRNRERLLNVISLEFSHTELDALVEAPSIVKLLDWVDLVWPKFLKQSQIESTNSIDKMKYPKVQKYCLMSVKGSYTDFHIDFGGTSVWYHILKGKKIFWMVPPTELNLQTFEEWTLSGQQQDFFFGDTVEECLRIELKAGMTFFIPSGWIHAVYTQEDSLVFGGNFLHSYGIENQLKVSRIEDATKVPIKFRYPFYTEILWYVVAHYVYCLTGKNHLHEVEHPTIETSNVTPTQATKQKTSAQEDSTESEPEKSDTTNLSRSRSTKRNGKNSAKGKKSSTASKRKKTQPPTSDEEDSSSTEIDSGNESPSKPAEKPANTCRMTKNSLLRLQYEIDAPTKETAPSKVAYHSESISREDSNSKKSTPKKIKSEEDSGRQKSQADAKRQSDSEPTNDKFASSKEMSCSINLSDMMMSHDSTKLNGWSSTSGQAIWSNPISDSDEPKKIHITKLEVNGLRALVRYLSKLSGAKKNLPILIRNSRLLLDDCRKLVAEHENDDPELAITGLPITADLLHTKRDDMNELIGKFFKQSDEIEDADKDHPVIEKRRTSFKASSSANSQPLSQQNKLKFTNDAILEGSSAFKSLVDGTSKKSSSMSVSPGSSNRNDMSPSKSSHYNQKETKCLSPNKRSASHGGNNATASSSSPPPRPKSPPTRPLSNNQYTSKNTQNSNLLLPGSFADLIAATSTEKKVFDVSAVDVNSTLFGTTKDRGSEKQQSKQSKTLSSSGAASSLSPLPKTTVSAVKPASAASNGQPTTAPRASSPEPPKLSPVKRFVSAAPRPPNREKLIYASAPYMSPVFSDASKSSCPWMSQQNQQQPQHQPQIQSSLDPSIRPTHSEGLNFGLSPRDPRFAHPAHHYTPHIPTPSSPTKLEHGSNQDARSSDWKTLEGPTSGITSTQQTLNSKPNNQQVQTAIAATTDKANVMIDDSKTDQQASMSKHPIRNVVYDSTLRGQVDPNFKAISPQNKAPPNIGEVSAHASSAGQSQKTLADEAKTSSVSVPAQLQPQAPPVHKPRGPLKKSKEAREAVDQQQDTAPQPPKPSVPVSVIKLGSTSMAIMPTTTMASIKPINVATSQNFVQVVRQHEQLPHQQQPQHQPNLGVGNLSQPLAKPQAKRPKKAHKQDNSNQVPSLAHVVPPRPSLPVQIATQAHAQNMTMNTLAHQSAMRGLVGAPHLPSLGMPPTMPPMTLANTVKGAGSQPYLIYQPLLLNAHAQPPVARPPPTSSFQFLPRVPFPLLTPPRMGGLLGYPMVQSPRIVWATPPLAGGAPGPVGAAMPRPMAGVMSPGPRASAIPTSHLIGVNNKGPGASSAIGGQVGPMHASNAQQLHWLTGKPTNTRL